MLALLATYSWQEVRHHAWRSATAVLAVMLGVALAFSVDRINASALDEFASAARSAGGQPDLELRAAQGALDEALYGRIATDPQVDLGVGEPVGEALGRGERRPDLLHGLPVAALEGQAEGVAVRRDDSVGGVAEQGRDKGAHCSFSK